MENYNKWYFRTSSIIIAFLIIGPLALPLVWFNPRFRLRTKIIATLAVAIPTYYLTRVVIDSLRAIRTYYQLIFQQL